MGTSFKSPLTCEMMSCVQTHGSTQGFPSAFLSLSCAPSLCCRCGALGSGFLCDSVSWGHADVLEVEALQEADPGPQEKT